MGKHRSVQLMGGDKVAFARSAAQVVCRNRVTEAERGISLLAEQNHVGELGVLLVAGRSFAEDTTSREDSSDGADDKSGRVESQVSSVVLRW